MSDYLEDVEKTLATLTRSSRQSVTMIVISAVVLLGSIVYSATRLAPLEREIQTKKEEIASLEVTERKMEESVNAARLELANLRGNIEKLYAVRVTEENTIFELRASSRATDRTSDQGPLYQFDVFINGSQSTLESINRVTYVFDHPTFRSKKQTSSDASNNFKVGYLGWGCLTSVTAQLQFHSGEQSEMKFNMCKSLGPQWWNDRSDKNAVPEGGAEAIEKVSRKRPVNASSSAMDSPVQLPSPQSNIGNAVSKAVPRDSCGLYWANGDENPCPAGCYRGRGVREDSRLDNSNAIQPRKLQRRQFECWREP
jgi:hypothetical protein